MNRNGKKVVPTSGGESSQQRVNHIAPNGDEYCLVCVCVHVGQLFRYKRPSKIEWWRPRGWNGLQK